MCSSDLKSVYEAYWDLRAASKMLMVKYLDDNLPAFLEECLWDALKQVPLDGDEFKSRLLAATEQVRKTLYTSDRFRGQGLVHLIGHSHLDLVFMWRYPEFVRKIGRTHATMLRLMERYPDWKFAQSQAKLYADMKQYYPDLYAQVKRRVTEGRWEPLGAFWVEPECNLISGESLVRQILYGQRFWQQ